MQTFERPTVQWLVITFFKQVMNVTLKQVPGKTAATITQQLPHPIHRLPEVLGEKTIANISRGKDKICCKWQVFVNRDVQ